MYTNYKLYVNEGIKLLESKGHNLEKINLEFFKMGTEFGSILAHLYGTNSQGLNQLGIKHLDEWGYGFNVFGYENSNEKFKLLTKEWIKQLKEKRSDKKMENK